MRMNIVVAAALASVTVAGVVTSARAQTYKQIYSFHGSKNGRFPDAGLVEFRGKLFGVTRAGGSHNCRGGCGTVFSVDPVTGRGKVIYAFQGGNDGAEPLGGLIVVGGLLYGTSSGGAAHAGTVFSIDPSTGWKKLVYSFNGGDDGDTPQASLLYVAGTLFGVTISGGPQTRGTVFSIDVATGAEKIVHAFQGEPDGQSPSANLIDVDGTLFGTTEYGGAMGAGTVFTVVPGTGAETILYSFAGGNDGTSPSAGLTKVGGELYGTTRFGGTGYQGTVFKIDPVYGTERLIYSFPSSLSSGSFPNGNLINVHNTLYGATSGGGVDGCKDSCGVVFAFDIAAETETVAYAFQGGNDGRVPNGSLTNVGGLLYGTTSNGGAADIGTVYSIAP